MRQRKHPLTRKQRRRQIRLRLLMIIAALLLLGGLFFMIHSARKARAAAGAADGDPAAEKYIAERPEFEVDLLPINEYSRPGTALTEVNGIVIHYTANPGTTARQNRDYFAGLAESHKTSASSHFVIGLSGEIIQCIPCNEIAYASNDRNSDTISIECCIPDETGKFNDSTYQSLVQLTAWLVGRYDLTVEDVIRHYDVTGKNCPKYFVEHESAWETFRSDISAYIAENGVDKTE